MSVCSSLFKCPSMIFVLTTLLHTSICVLNSNKQKGVNEPNGSVKTSVNAPLDIYKKC